MKHPAKKYKVLVVDPPWNQGKTGKRKVRPNQGTCLDYPTMTKAEILALPIGDWAEERSFLWLWATNSKDRTSKEPILKIAFDVMEAWDLHFIQWQRGIKVLALVRLARTRSSLSTCYSVTKARLNLTGQLWAKCKPYFLGHLLYTQRNQTVFTSKLMHCLRVKSLMCLLAKNATVLMVGETNMDH